MNLRRLPFPLSAILVFTLPLSFRADQAVRVVEGSNVSLSVVADGSEPFNFQWRKNGTPVAGATAVTFELRNVQAADAGEYRVVVSNSLGSTVSDTAILSVDSAPDPRLAQSITFDPIAARSTSDPPYALEATASSGLDIAYSSSNPSVATVDGNIVTIVGEGKTIITATQPGSPEYLPATPVDQVLTVTQGVPRPPTNLRVAP